MTPIKCLYVKDRLHFLTSNSCSYESSSGSLSIYGVTVSLPSPTEDGAFTLHVCPLTFLILYLLEFHTNLTLLLSYPSILTFKSILIPGSIFTHQSGLQPLIESL